MEWWGYVIIAGVIFIFAALVLIWIIVASNRIVVLKKKVDRHYSLINSKLKDYNRAVDKVLIYVYKNIETKSKTVANLKMANKELATTEGIFNKFEAQKNTREMIENFKAFCKKQEKLKKSKKLKDLFAEIAEIQQGICAITEKHNAAASEYNVTIARFPTILIAERFKFEKAKKFNIKD